MFDIGFWEVSLIGVLALIIIGPERLPGVARSAGKWMGKARRMMTDIKSDIKSELDESELSELKSIGEDIRGAGENFKSQLEAGEKKLQSEGSAMDTAIAGALNKVADDEMPGVSESNDKKEAVKKKPTKKKTAKSTSATKATAPKVTAKKKATKKTSSKKKVAKKKTAKKKASKKKATPKASKKPADKTASKPTQSA